MRIIAGKAGGIPIKVPSQVARPTTDRVREAMFSMLGDRVPGARVLDLFAGSGALGIESLSRGAESAVLVEQDLSACRLISENLQKARLEQGRVVKGEVFATLRRLAQQGEKFALVFADPPYAKIPGQPNLGAQLLVNEPLRALLADGGWLVLETMVTKGADRSIAGWTVLRDREYGSTRILILAIADSSDGEISSVADL